MSEIERIARLICKAQHAGIDPDQRVSTGIPYSTGNFYVIPHREMTTPAWRIFEPAARAVVDDAERKAEMDRAERDY